MPAATTASSFDAVANWALQSRTVPDLRFVNRYHDHPGYIAALAASVLAHWHQQGRGQKLVMSFQASLAYTSWREFPNLDPRANIAVNQD